MSKFQLKTATIEVRGQSVKVRELTAGERAELVKISADKTHASFYVMSKAAIEPTWTEQEAMEEPSEVVDLIAGKALELMGLAEEKKD